MWLAIPEIILRSRSLTGEAKILLSYVVLLSQSGKLMYATDEFFLNQFGIKDPQPSLELLSRKGHIEKTKDGWRLSQEALYKLGKGK